jgi:hypothetical protein
VMSGANILHNSFDGWPLENRHKLTRNTSKAAMA